MKNLALRAIWLSHLAIDVALFLVVFYLVCLQPLAGVVTLIVAYVGWMLWMRKHPDGGLLP